MELRSQAPGNSQGDIALRDRSIDLSCLEAVEVCEEQTGAIADACLMHDYILRRGDLNVAFSTDGVEKGGLSGGIRTGKVLLCASEISDLRPVWEALRTFYGLQLRIEGSGQHDPSVPGDIVAQICCFLAAHDFYIGKHQYLSVKPAEISRRNNLKLNMVLEQHQQHAAIGIYKVRRIVVSCGVGKVDACLSHRLSQCAEDIFVLCDPVEDLDACRNIIGPGHHMPARVPEVGAGNEFRHGEVQHGVARRHVSGAIP